jgi:hypothetical protein
MPLWLSVAAGAALLVALAALAATRRLRRRLDALTQSYWELRYEFTRLRSQVARLDPAQQAATEAPEAQPNAVAFVPLSALRPGSRKQP